MAEESNPLPRAPRSEARPHKYAAALARARACAGVPLVNNVIGNLLADRYNNAADIETDLQDLEARAAYCRNYEAAVAARDAKKGIAP